MPRAATASVVASRCAAAAVRRSGALRTGNSSAKHAGAAPTSTTRRQVSGTASRTSTHRLKQIAGAWAFVLVALGVGAAWLANLNLFGIWSIPVRNSDIGVTLTGILLAGVAYFWREILGMFGGLYRKYTDEAKLMENSETLRRVA